MLPGRVRSCAQTQYYRALLTLRRNHREIWFTPTTPSIKRFDYSIMKVCAELGLWPHSERTPNTVLGVWWEDATFTQSASIPDLAIVNSNCADISKSRVHNVFYESFGYSISIDPLQYKGRAVSKSEMNSFHDGRIIECPIKSRKPDRVYELLVDNAVGRNVEDIRIPVVGSQLPFCYLKTRPIDVRFGNSNLRASIAPLESVITRREHSALLRFAKGIGLEFGEVDALRDRRSGRLYVVDANKTAAGPPKPLSFWDQARAVRRLAEVFEAEFLGV